MKKLPLNFDVENKKLAELKGLLKKEKIWKENFYINTKLWEALS